MRNRDAGKAAVASCGFSLLELLVAFTIFALITGAVLETFGTGLRNTRLAGEYACAVMHAQAKLAELGVREILVEGVDAGRFNDIYGWRTEVKRFEREAPEPPADELVKPLETMVEVFWGEGARRRTVTLRSLELKVQP